MNKVMLIGRITREPELKHSQNGDVAIVRFGLAVNRKYKVDGGQDADFPNIVAFGKTAEFINKYFGKGSKMVVEGRLQTGSYTDKEGHKHYTTEVIAEDVEFAESKKVANGEINGFIEDDDTGELPFM